MAAVGGFIVLIAVGGILATLLRANRRILRQGVS